MIDDTNTSVDWERHSGKILILPVGAMEQHSAHLPLATDNIQVEHFARLLAEDLDAALLPVLSICTSLEHSGFRGSFTLRPETLMQIIRDLADGAEEQGFRYLVVLNGHGGNFSLSPVCRDINRCDRPIKILLVNWYDGLYQMPSPATEDSKPKGMEMHAGETETSLMLILRPDLVGKERMDNPEIIEEEFPLTQPDLNLFGVAHLNPLGTIGYPSLATEEKGRAIIENVRKKLPLLIRDRIQRLKKDPRYGANGSRGLSETAN